MRPVLPPDLRPHAFLTLEEAANLLNVKLRWMRDAIEDDRIAYYKVGRLVRIQAADLAQFMATCRVEAGARSGRGTAQTRKADRPAGATRVSPPEVGPAPEEATVVPITGTTAPRTRPVA